MENKDLMLLKKTINAINSSCLGLYLLNKAYGGIYHPEEYYLKEVLYKLQKELDKLIK